MPNKHSNEAQRNEEPIKREGELQPAQDPEMSVPQKVPPSPEIRLRACLLHCVVCLMKATTNPYHESDRQNQYNWLMENLRNVNKHLEPALSKLRQMPIARPLSEGGKGLAHTIGTERTASSLSMELKSSSQNEAAPLEGTGTPLLICICLGLWAMCACISYCPKRIICLNQKYSSRWGVGW
jgi:hypothetical protein